MWGEDKEEEGGAIAEVVRDHGGAVASIRVRRRAKSGGGEGNGNGERAEERACEHVRPVLFCCRKSVREKTT